MPYAEMRGYHATVFDLLLNRCETGDSDDSTLVDQLDYNESTTPINDRYASDQKGFGLL